MSVKFLFSVDFLGGKKGEDGGMEDQIEIIPFSDAFKSCSVSSCLRSSSWIFAFAPVSSATSQARMTFTTYIVDIS